MSGQSGQGGHGNEDRGSPNGDRASNRRREGVEEGEGCGKGRILKVGIVGGGIGGMGLALACQGLGKGKIHAEVFEMDASFDARSQGYGLTMQQGMRVLHALGIPMEGVGVSSSCHFSFLPDGENIGCYGREVRDLVEPGAGSDQVGKVDAGPLVCWKCKGTGQRVISRKHPEPKDCAVCSGSGELRPRPACEYNVHLPRQMLRRMLMERVDKDTIFWGHKVSHYEVHNDGTVTVSFLGGHANRTFDLLVGADGIYSVVRRLRLAGGDATNDPLRPLGVMVVLGIAHLGHPALESRVFQTLDGETRIYCMPFDAAGPDGLQPTMWQLSYPIRKGDAVLRDPSALREEALRRCGSWHPPIPDLIGVTSPDNITGYPAFDRDVVEPSFLRQGGEGGGGAHAHVTLIGDALHPMSPFKGQGANTALLDALDLVRTLLSAPLRANNKVCSGSAEDALPVRLAKFEEAVIQRSRSKVQNSRTAASVLHSPEACQKAHCVRAGAALGSDDPQAQPARISVPEEASNEMAVRMQQLLFGGVVAPSSRPYP